VDDDCKKGKPFIRVLDSMDALTSEAEDEKFEEQKKARRKGNDAAGSYGDGKAKKNSSGIRRVLAALRRSGSILIIICQTRDNLGFGFEKKTRSGGRALRFYATLELWSSIKGVISKNVLGKSRQIGIRCGIQVKKNRITGRIPPIEIPIYTSSGFDDTGSCVDYLIEEGHWSETKGKVTAPEFDFTGKPEKLIQMIEGGGWEKELHQLVSEIWYKIEKACTVERKPRYA
jgi:RecA/RadA recombinase